jgi:hypothetical protein
MCFRTSLQLMPIDPDTLVAYAQLIIDTSKGYVGHPQVQREKKKSGGKRGSTN